LVIANRFIVGLVNYKIEKGKSETVCEVGVEKLKANDRLKSG
jgi:hypothetical protein